MKNSDSPKIFTLYFSKYNNVPAFFAKNPIIINTIPLILNQKNKEEEQE